jgi:tetratricopeptide (TPR) repeat protein
MKTHALAWVDQRRSARYTPLSSLGGEMAGLLPWCAIALSLIASAAQAAGDPDLRTCHEGAGPRGVAACSRLIENPKTARDELPYAFAARSFHLEIMGDDDDAFADANRAIQLNPDVAYFYDNRSNAGRRLDKLDDALADANKALALDPKDMSALLNRGLVYKARHDLDAALADFSAYLKRETGVAEAFTFRGEARSEKGLYDLAVADFTRSIGLKEDGDRPYRLRARTYLLMKKYNLAIADFSEVLDEKPKDAWALFERGTAKTESGDKAGGQIDMDRAHAIDGRVEAIFKDKEF